MSIDPDCPACVQGAHWLRTGRCGSSDDTCTNPACLPAAESNARHCFPGEYAAFVEGGRIHPDVNPGEDGTPKRHGVVCVGVDLGGRNDETAVVVAIPRADGVDVINAATLPLRDNRDEIGYHAAQFEVVKGFCGRYMDQGYRVTLAFDMTREDAASDQLRLILKPLLDTGRMELVRCWFTGGDGPPKWKGSAAKHDTRVNVPKNGLVDTVRALGQRQRADGRSFVQHIGYAPHMQAKLLRQMSAFAAKVTQSGNVTYEASRGHDDLVTAYMLSLLVAAPTQRMRITNPARHVGSLFRRPGVSTGGSAGDAAPVDRADAVARMARDGSLPTMSDAAMRRDYWRPSHADRYRRRVGGSG